ncbi:adenine nucleotide alpha hydrolases-like protein [Dacryopinax primogenitus]|uniref:FAD synthase n=1 Tax=Dacryopinax primogenitus (strain DJM 731) TaxID=1858805 RepID=M5FUJ0_DACPD|nr:adenine nucleotide alpha hydrolases-like protein [Dacryopinax primogenitus]EJU01416.1 adenine nucleotide alpha hydrolases-like protein [Dacryopinax primogenitus]
MSSSPTSPTTGSITLLPQPSSSSPTVSLTSLSKLYSYARSSPSPSDTLHPHVKEAVEVIEAALEEHGEENVALSFNGGKDCTVLLHLLAAVLLHRHPPQSSSTPPWPAIPSIYVSQPSPFPLMESFVHSSTSYYSLSLLLTRHKSMKSALSAYLSLRPWTKAIMVGTRRQDPHGRELRFRQMTDPGWPAFERIHPVINWGYAEVWWFLREWEVPYCQLYDLGYTSLGSTYNTFPNPALAAKGGYRPAYELEDESLERAGREEGRSPVLVQRQLQDAQAEQGKWEVDGVEGHGGMNGSVLHPPEAEESGEVVAGEKGEVLVNAEMEEQEDEDDTGSL